MCRKKNGWIYNKILKVMRFQYLYKYNGIYDKKNISKHFGRLTMTKKENTAI